MIVPEGTDPEDEAILKQLVEDDEAIVNGYVFVLSWVDAEGEQRWRCYVNSELPVSGTVGLLEMAKLNVLGRADAGMPFSYGDG